MNRGYFWSFGRCDHCGWPHHTRHDRPARPARWWRKAEPATSWVECFNCHKRTDLASTEGDDRG